MSTIAELNATTSADLKHKYYDTLALLNFREASKLGMVIDNRRKLAPKGVRTVSWTEISGVAAPTKVNAGSDFSYTSATAAALEGSWDAYKGGARFDDTTQAGTGINLSDSLIQEYAGIGGETYDSVIAEALVAGTNVTYIGHAAKADITAADVLTEAKIRQAVAQMEGANVPKFMIPGFGLCYVVIVHPHVHFDLFGQSSGIGASLVYAGVDQWKLNDIKEACGCIWIKSSNPNLLESNAGAGSTVDVYKTLVVGMNSVGMVGSPVDRSKYADVFLNISGDQTLVAQVIPQPSQGGAVTEATIHGNLGAKILKQAGVRVLCSASSIGANT